MKLTGRIRKMRARLAEQVIYHLPVENEWVLMNEFVGKKIALRFEHEIYCTGCEKPIKKSFRGFCWDCFSVSPENAECILRPEMCLAHEGKGRDAAWEKEHHLQEHFVYLALSGNVKVGVTRSTQVPVRWIDQGASSAICFAKTPYRQLAGRIEVEMKKHFSDKTNWQKMLKGEEAEGIDLIEVKWKAEEYLPKELRQYFFEDDTITHLHYPVLQYPRRLKSIDFEKQNHLSGRLTGIKGQYLIFDDHSVLNVRRHEGYVIGLEG